MTTPQTTPRRGADALVETLIAHGVTTLFGVPGDTGVVLYDALFHRTDEIEHVLARDERHAAAMADGYARVTNRVGVVEVSSGGGTTYVVGGLGEAFASGIPVLLITSDIHASSRGTGALTEIDQVALFTAVTKWRTVVESADEVPGAVAEALRVAVSGRPAPVAVIVPENVLEELTSAPVPVTTAVVPAGRPLADAGAVAEAVRLLAGAERPVVVAGGGVHLSGAHAGVAELAARLGAGVAGTIHGRGAVATDDPWWLGLVGNNSGQPGTNAHVAAADVVLLVGTRGNATDTNSWTAPARTGQAVVQIDVDAARAGRNFPGSTALVGDCRAVLGQLLDALEPTPEAVLRERAEAVAEARGNATPRTEGGEHAPGVLYPRAVVELLHELLGEDVVVVADPGTPTPNTAAFWPQARAGRKVVIPRGHGPMGYAIPAAIGVAKALPGTRVVSVTADGSFAMACGELETAARFSLPVLFVQFTNHSMGWIKMLQHLYTEGRYFGVDPGPVDAALVARANGVEGTAVTSLEELRAAVVDFVEDPRPRYLDVVVPHMIDYSPPVPAWDRGLAGDTTRPVY
ncbi:thiamine pyrophosphate-binding protein [Actinosynnema mirum]|uniref:Thiamine pyrophosphate protein TPP binding domain protein n=1 Tax=Actinosynnema mirum (strain ATCC 29888 / DSM 43827 / JCM 3225 / NBRC 14064 / NCIMB 13271 / NRRL B-12336 / IMRU 3971 / 101) TaxID=446462 RepID=C6WQC1_ACTMD|nr:thiamine pyrophosphate-binding protein [Actinosynnema mirum]ACU36775.1 thiamine pyrophosphate protein TPP binding domain protein [Actinosynnema mirum DSM 43827]